MLGCQISDHLPWLLEITSWCFDLSLSTEWIDVESSWLSLWRAAKDFSSSGSNALKSLIQSVTMLSAMTLFFSYFYTHFLAVTLFLLLEWWWQIVFLEYIKSSTTFFFDLWKVIISLINDFFHKRHWHNYSTDSIAILAIFDLCKFSPFSMAKLNFFCKINNYRKLRHYTRLSNSSSINIDKAITNSYIRIELRCQSP
jgi:hypothetical protein